MNASLEIINANNESVGLPGTNLSASAVPVIVESLFGITGLSKVTPQPAPTGRVPQNAWVGTQNGMQVRVLLWGEPPVPPVFPNPEDSEG